MNGKIKRIVTYHRGVRKASRGEYLGRLGIIPIQAPIKTGNHVLWGFNDNSVIVLILGGNMIIYLEGVIIVFSNT